MSNIAGCSREEWNRTKKEFNKEYENFKKCNKSFDELIREFLDDENCASFSNRTGLEGNMLSRFRSPSYAEKSIHIKYIISVCIGYDLDLSIAQVLLSKLGIIFNFSKKRDRAYMLLLTKFRNRSIEECNEVLEELGIEKKDWLGSAERK